MPATSHTTHWSIVATAQGVGVPARAALEQLCTTYWFAMYAFLRRRGIAHHDALDLVQSFCADLLAGQERLSADPNRGSFRAYLEGALRHFAGADARRQRALKRGGGGLVFDSTDAETRYALEPVDTSTPERLLERGFALAALHGALTRLETEYAERGCANLFTALRPVLGRESDAPTYAAIADALAMTEGAVKVAVHRLRTRLRECLRAEVAHTLEDPGDVDEELRHLLAALGS